VQLGLPHFIEVKFQSTPYREEANMLVVCNGMIRSGSTMQYNLVRTLLEKQNIGRANGFFDNSNYPLTEDQIDQWVNDDYYHVIKMHDLHPRIERIAKNEKSDILKICYIYRDIRDVAASAKIKWNLEGKNLIASLNRTIYNYYKIKEIKNILFQRYETVITSLSQSVKEIANFLNINLEEEIINRVANECLIVNLKKYSRKPTRLFLKKFFSLKKFIPAELKKLLKDTFHIKSIVYDKKTLLHPRHISENGGLIGKWIVVLNDYEKNIITDRYKNWLTETGYLRENSLNG